MNWQIDSMTFYATDVYLFHDNGTVQVNGKTFYCPNNCYSCMQIGDRLACFVCGFYLVPVESE